MSLDMAIGFLDTSDRIGTVPGEEPPGGLATEIETRFRERLLRLARTRLDRRLVPRIDEDDVLQSVLRSFFVRHADGQFAFESWNEVWNLLVLMTKRKCVKQAQVHFAERRDVRRNSGLAGDSDDSVVDASPAGPMAAEVVLLAEASDRLWQELSDRERDVLALALAGRTIEQIGAELNRTQRTVRRLLGRVRERLERMAAEDV
jgi:RNA polymerase sigma-70 factor (ECF subfamily)